MIDPTIYIVAPLDHYDITSHWICMLQLLKAPNKGKGIMSQAWRIDQFYVFTTLGMEKPRPTKSASENVPFQSSHASYR